MRPRDGLIRPSPGLGRAGGPLPRGTRCTVDLAPGEPGGYLRGGPRPRPRGIRGIRRPHAPSAVRASPPPLPRGPGDGGSDPARARRGRWSGADEGAGSSPGRVGGRRRGGRDSQQGRPSGSGGKGPRISAGPRGGRPGRQGRPFARGRVAPFHGAGSGHGAGSRSARRGGARSRVAFCGAGGRVAPWSRVGDAPAAIHPCERAGLGHGKQRGGEGRVCPPLSRHAGWPSALAIPIAPASGSAARRRLLPRPARGDRCRGAWAVTDRRLPTAGSPSTGRARPAGRKTAIDRRSHRARRLGGSDNSPGPEHREVGRSEDGVRHMPHPRLTTAWPTRACGLVLPFRVAHDPRQRRRGDVRHADTSDAFAHGIDTIRNGREGK